MGRKPIYNNVPFSELPLDERACLILRMAGYSTREIETFTRSDISHSTIARHIRKAKEKYLIDVEYGKVRYQDLEEVIVGSSKDLDYLNGKANDRPEGGGRHKRAIRYNDNWQTDDTGFEHENPYI